MSSFSDDAERSSKRQKLIDNFSMTAYEKVKRQYFKKKADSTLTMDDEIAYINAERARLAKRNQDNKNSDLCSQASRSAILTVIEDGARELARQLEEADVTIEGLQKGKEDLMEEKVGLASKNLDIAVELSSLRHELACAKDELAQMKVATEEEKKGARSLESELVLARKEARLSQKSAEEAKANELELKSRLRIWKEQVQWEENVIAIAKKVTSLGGAKGNWKTFGEALEELRKAVA